MITRLEIQEAIKDIKWQEFRVSLKGVSTEKKLESLNKYLNNNRTHNKEVQVENYINALKRGGQIK